jgi:broad specificity phosphatase PhoE
MIEITLIRHGETVANAAGIWQGHGDAGLSEEGFRQVSALADRLAGERFDRVVCSDLKRARQTADALGLDAEPDPAWREVDIGAWEGLGRDEVYDRFPAEIAALAAGEDVPLGGGESWSRFGIRIDGAFGRLAAGLEDGQRALVVCHGGAIHSIVAGHLGFRSLPRPWPIAALENTSLTVLRDGIHGRALHSFNDATHLREAPPPGPGTVVGLVRHGETTANLEGRWAGTTDAPLTERGAAQAVALASRYDGAAAVYSSPLARARLTAARLADAHGLEVVVRPDLGELDFGRWENLTSEEVIDRYPDEWNRVYVEGHDLARGGTGETAAAAALRLGSALGELARHHPGERIVVVAHGGLIRSYVGSLVGVGHAGRHRLALPGNTSVSHLRLQDGSAVLADYNVLAG